MLAQYLGDIAVHNLVDEVVGEEVVSRRHRRMRSEDDLILDLFDIAVALLTQQLKREEARVSLVEVEGRNVAVTHVAQQTQAADAEDKLLTEAVLVVAAVELGCELPVLGRIFGQVGVDEIDRQRVLRLPDKHVTPCSDGHWVSVHRDCYAVWQLRHKVTRIPVHGILRLPSLLIDLLREITLFIEQRHRHHRHPKVGGAL